MLTTILLILADVALGAMALKLGKSNEKVTQAIQQTQATMQLILSKHADKLDDHDRRIVIIEKSN